MDPPLTAFGSSINSLVEKRLREVVAEGGIFFPLTCQLCVVSLIKHSEIRLMAVPRAKLGSWRFGLACMQ